MEESFSRGGMIVVCLVRASLASAWVHAMASRVGEGPSFLSTLIVFLGIANRRFSR